MQAEVVSAVCCIMAAEVLVVMALEASSAAQLLPELDVNEEVERR